MIVYFADNFNAFMVKLNRNNGLGNFISPLYFDLNLIKKAR